MKHIGTIQAVVTADEPTAAELDAIEAEMPVIRAEMELLDAQIITIDRIPSEMDVRRLRRARRRVLTAHRDQVNTAAEQAGGAA